MGVKRIYAVFKIVIHKGAEGFCADAVSPQTGLAYINTDSAADGLAVLDFSYPFAVFVYKIGAYPSDVPAVPFDFKPPPARVIGEILYGFIVFRPAFAFACLVGILLLPRSVPAFPFPLQRKSTHIVLDIGRCHIPQKDVFKFNLHHCLL